MNSKETSARDKKLLFGSIFAPGIIATAGLVAGLASDKESDIDRYTDLGFQAGGIIGGIGILSNKAARKTLGAIGMGGVVGGAITTMASSAMQADDASPYQRGGMMLASYAGGTLAGGAIGLGIAKLTKPLMKVA